MKTRIFIKGLVFAIAVYASVEVVSGQSQSSSKKIYFRFGEKQVKEFVNELNNSNKSSTKKVFTRKTGRTEKSEMLSWYFNTNEWNTENNNVDEQKISLKKWMFQAAEMLSMNEMDNRNAEAVVMEDWMFDADKMKSGDKSSQEAMSNPEWMYNTEYWK